MGEQPIERDWLPNPDLASTGDGRMITAAINELTLEINALRLALAADPHP